MTYSGLIRLFTFDGIPSLNQLVIDQNIHWGIGVIQLHPQHSIQQGIDLAKQQQQQTCVNKNGYYIRQFLIEGWLPHVNFDSNSDTSLRTVHSNNFLGCNYYIYAVQASGIINQGFCIQKESCYKKAITKGQPCHAFAFTFTTLSSIQSPCTITKVDHL